MSMSPHKDYLPTEPTEFRELSYCTSAVSKNFINVIDFTWVRSLVNSLIHDPSKINASSQS